MAGVVHVLRYVTATGQVMGSAPYASDLGACPEDCTEITHDASVWPGPGRGELGVFTGHAVHEGTIADLDAWIATSPARWELLAVRRCELANQNRSGALASLDAALGA